MQIDCAVAELAVGKAWVWKARQSKPFSVIETDNPECEIDGDRFWIWVGDDEVMVGFEEMTGQEVAAARWLLSVMPDVAQIPISERSPSGAYGTLGGMAAAADPAVRRATEVDTWFHGTTTEKLGGILSQGLHGEMPVGERSWRNVADPDFGVVYLAVDRLTAVEYARKACQMFGGDEVIIEIRGAAMVDGIFVEDRDFRHTHEFDAFRAGDMPGLDAADASLSYDGKVGWEGRIRPDAFMSARYVETGVEIGLVCDGPVPG